ncbi:MAG: right-handed parallel beta-helix repeat-containing protein [Methanotrichaceae archaeon]
MQIRACQVRNLVATAFALIFFVGITNGALVFADDDIQAAIDNANPGDTVIVGSGQYEPFIVEKSLIIQGIEDPVVDTKIQIPAITIRSDDVTLSGFKVVGVPENSESKYKYYMKLSDRKPNYELNMPNAAILVDGNDVIIEETEILRAEVGIFVNGAANVTLSNDTFQRCESGTKFLYCRDSRIESCIFAECKKYGAYVEQSQKVSLVENEVMNTSSMGILMKKSSNCLAERNIFSGNWEGLVLLNSSFCELRRNQADRNLYYGIVVTSSSNNTVVDNLARENGGIGGISLQDNSSYNIVARNTVEKNLNGLEAIDGCQFNLICCNNISDNRKGVRVKENQNNLIYRNNFRRNQVTVRDNASHNFWNASVGNYYDDYSGQDYDDDGIGDEPYRIPAGSSCATDWRPLMRPAGTEIDLVAAKDDLSLYATYQPEENNPYKIENRTIVIKSKKPTKSWWL